MEFRGIRDPNKEAQMQAPTPKGFGGVPVFRSLLHYKLAGGLLSLIILILVASCYVIWFSGRPFLLALSKHSQEEIGRNVVLGLSEHLGEIQGISRSMAEIAAYAPHDPKLYRKVFPQLLNSLGADSMIAGGGVWPEPYRFDEEKVRSSFFWGRDEQGHLKFYDDYNAEDGKGYHNEEWYVPASYLTQNALYWSRSYTDPHSRQPMVTCTSPIIQEGVFVGVATVDLMLEKVSSILEDIVNSVDAYAFILDRNEKLIAYPFPDYVTVERETSGGQSPDYLYLDELTQKEPRFSPIADHLFSIKHQLSNAYSASSPYYHQLVEEIARRSYQITTPEAKIIAANIWNSKTKKSVMSDDIYRLEMEDDPVFGEAASIMVYVMPNTGWKLVISFKRSSYMKEPLKMSQKLLILVVSSVALFGVIAYVILNRSVMQPIKNMTVQIAESVSHDSKADTRIVVETNDELGQLAYWFNLRSEQLERARDIADIANQAKTNFIAKMSHELRTPLNSVIGFSRRLKDTLNGQLDDRSYSSITKIYENGKMLLEVINEILDLSDLEKGEQSLQLDVHRVNAMLDVVKKNAEKLKRKSGVKLSVHMIEGEEYLYCDREKFIQVLMNLISNAVKCTNTGSITVVCRRVIEQQQPMIKVDVIDTGAGIQSDDLDKLFVKFSQINSRIGVDKGAGLGLYITKRIVELHKGKVDVRSLFGEGSTFTVYFPLEHYTVPHYS